MRLANRLVPHGITAQITAIVAVSVVLGAILTLILKVVLHDASYTDSPTATAARVACVIQMARAANTADEIDAIVSTAQRAGIKVARVPASETGATAEADAAPSAMVELTRHRLEAGWNITDTKSIDGDETQPGKLAAAINKDTVLVFETPNINAWWPQVVSTMSFLLLLIMAVFIVIASFYGVRYINRPLSALAAAAASFGRSPADDKVVKFEAPREIAQVADAINDMRTRIRGLIEDRTRMLTAISHDLRTPLTRLRLRAERVSQCELREGMLREIGQIGRMLDETLDFLHHQSQVEEMARVDLPSLLQSVCTEFADVGHSVAYEGPGRLTVSCRPGRLGRAISNIVDNGVKHGSRVAVRLRAGGDGYAVIDIADDGPGIAAHLRAKVFAPFFKGDDARTSTTRSGFGLGLPIARNVIEGHGGKIDLLDGAPCGLLVRISLPQNG